jgi:predicted Zn finger-like uncharacterized protein
MRLTCPNCSARYEVADSMIPPEGRDVQCSNCSTTWFQPGRRTDVAPAVRVERPAPEVPEAARAASERAATEVSEPPAPPAPDREERASAAPEPPAPSGPPAAYAAPVAAAATVVPPTVQAPAEAPPEAPPPPPRQRREIDPEVRDILREEAEREARLRQAEAAPVETQGEMPLSEEQDDANRARRRAELDAAKDAFAPDASAPAARDLFPDIDEINSTLRDTRDRSGTEQDATDIDTLDTAPRRRRGTRIGFLLAIALAAGAVGVYGNTERIALYLPEAAPVLDRFETAVDGARFWLDDLARGLVEAAGGA